MPMEQCEHIRAGELMTFQAGPGEVPLYGECNPCDAMRDHLDELAPYLADANRPEGKGLLWPKAEVHWAYPGYVSVSPIDDDGTSVLDLAHWCDELSITASPGWEGIVAIWLSVNMGGSALLEDADGEDCLSRDIPVTWTGDLDADAELWANAILGDLPEIIRVIRLMDCGDRSTLWDSVARPACK